MKSPTPRTRRMGQQIRRELAEIIPTLGNTQLALASITEVDVSPDFSYARIHITSLCAAPDRPQQVADLNRVAPLLRKALGQRLRARTVPRLEFRYDDVVEYGAHLSALIAAATKPISGSTV